MGLSTQFSLPNSSFDPTKYGGKSSTLATSVLKALPQPDSATPATTTTSAAQKLGIRESTNTGTCSTNTDTSVSSKHTGHEAEIKQTGSFSSSELEEIDPVSKDFNIVTMSDFLKEQPAFVSRPQMETTKDTILSTKDKPTTSPDVDIQQHIALSSSEWDGVDNVMLKDLNTVTTTDIPSDVDQHAVVANSNIVPTKPASGEGQSCPPTLLTAEMWTKAWIPPPDEPVSTSTRRLVSIRCIRNIQQAKVENRWLTLAQVDEWTSIVPRRAFREGDLVVYVEIDAFLPSADERFGKMASLQTYDGGLGHKVKTRRFGSHPDKLLVQGYIYPIDKFEEIYEEIKCVEQYLDNAPTNKSRQDMIKKIICVIYRNRDWAVEIGVKKWEESKQVNKPDKHPKLGAIPTRVLKKTDITHFEVRNFWSDGFSFLVTSTLYYCSITSLGVIWLRND